MITVIANLKGGSGKSTVTFNLGIWLCHRDKTVVAYDLDPQQTLKDVAQVRIEDEVEPVFQVYRLAEDDPVVEMLTRHRGEVLVDVGASNMDAMREAVRVATRVLIPVPPGQPDVWATQRFLHGLFEDRSDRSTEIIAFINRADTHHAVRESDEAEEALRQIDGLQVLPHRLCQRTPYRRSLSEGLSVIELSAKSKSAREFDQFARALYPDTGH